MTVEKLFTVNTADRFTCVLVPSKCVHKDVAHVFFQGVVINLDGTERINVLVHSTKMHGQHVLSMGLLSFL